MVTLPCGWVNRSLLIPHVLFNSISQKWGSKRNRTVEGNVRRCSSVQEHPGLHPAHSAWVALLLFFSLKKCAFLNFHVCFCSHCRQWARTQSEKQTWPSHTSTCFNICCFSDSFTDVAGLCPVYYEPCKIFPATESLIHISFQILQLHFSEAHVCVGEGM